MGATAMKIWEWFLWGLCMGIGWTVGQNLINLIGALFHR